MSKNVQNKFPCVLEKKNIELIPSSSFDESYDRLIDYLKKLMIAESYFEIVSK